MGRFWKGFFWGAPSHRRIAWVGALAGVGVLALAGVVFGKGAPLFVLAVLLLGLAEFGWAAELLPRQPRCAGRLGAAGALAVRSGCDDPSRPLSVVGADPARVVWGCHRWYRRAARLRDVSRWSGQSPVKPSWGREPDVHTFPRIAAHRFHQISVARVRNRAVSCDVMRCDEPSWGEP
jgi:hypothetical protein